MITLNVFFDINPAHKDAFLALLNTMVTESIKEEGCHYYQLWQNHAQPLSFSLIELWENKDCLVSHQKTPHWIAFNDLVNGYLSRPYDEHHYAEIAR